MERVKSNKEWTLMCPDECPGLSDCYGEDFKKLYEHYEKLKGRKTIKVKIYGLKFVNLKLKQEHLIYYIKIL